MAAFVIKMNSGELFLDVSNEDNNEIIDVDWVFIDEEEKFDTYTAPLLKILLDEIK